MITINSKTELTKRILTKRISKTDLNKQAQSCYGSGVFCEHVRSGKRGWYLYKDTEKTFLGANSSEALSYLQSQESVTRMSTTAALLTPDTARVSNLVTKPQVVTKPSAPAKTKSPPEKPEIPPEKLLEILMEKFPNTFFREPEKIRPLQRYIHKKIRRVLNNEYSKNELSAALALYTQTIDYCRKMMEGGQRIDIEGNLCEEMSPQHIEDAKARFTGETTMRPAKKRKPKIPRVPLLPPQLEQLVSGIMELCVKINELPGDSRTLKNGWEEFIIDADDQNVKIKVRPRTWKKLQQAAREYPSWVANIRGQMGERIKGGFELLRPSVQIFEKSCRTGEK